MAIPRKSGVLYDFKKVLLLHLGVFFTLILLYLPALNADLFSLDDKNLLFVPALQGPLSWRSLLTIFSIGSHIDYYPIRDLTYLVDLHLWPNSVSAMRVHQIFWIWVTFLFAGRILTQFKVRFSLIFFPLMIWVFHPCHAETLMWISARKDVLALALGTVSVDFLLRSKSLKQDKMKNFYSLFFYCASLLSKASLSVLPFAGLLGNFLKLPRLANKKTRVTILIASGLSLLSSINQTFIYSEINPMVRWIPWDERAQLSLIALGKMISAWFVSNANILESDNFGEWSFLNHNYFYVGLIFLILFVALGISALARKNKSLFFCLACLFSLYLPISGWAFPHRAFFTTRYFEPTGLALFMMMSCCAEQFLKTHPKIRLRFSSYPQVQTQSILHYFLGFILVLTIWHTSQEALIWESSISVRQKALATHPTSLSLQSYLWVDVKNLKRMGPLSSPDTEEFSTLEKTLELSLARECKKLLQSKSVDPSLANCHVYFRTAYLDAIENNNLKLAEELLGHFVQANSLLHPVPPITLRYQIEHQLRTNQWDRSLWRKWSDEVRTFPSPTYRLIHLTDLCLHGNESFARYQYQSYLHDMLLEAQDTKFEILEKLHPFLKTKILKCLIF